MRQGNCRQAGKNVGIQQVEEHELGQHTSCICYYLGRAVMAVGFNLTFLVLLVIRCLPSRNEDLGQS